MSSDIVLTAALRSNLLSLQSTQKLIDTTQLRLATGLKVNSALDNPQNFFAAQALNNRAADLTRLLDGISQSIRAIEEADKGVSALTSLLDQAQSITASARDELAASEGVARVVGNVDLSNSATIISANIITGDDFRITTTDANGDQIVETIALVTGDTGYTLAAKITDQFRDNRAGEVEAKINSQGFLEINSTTGRAFKIADYDATGLGTAGYAEIGLGSFVEDELRNGNTFAGVTVIPGTTLRSISIYEAADGVNLAEAGDEIAGATFYDAAGNTVLAAFNTGDTFEFSVNDSGTITSGAVALSAAATFQDLVDSINQNTAINDYIQANFDDDTGVLSFTALRDDVDNFAIDIVAANAGATRTFDIGLGDPNGTLEGGSTAPTISVNNTYDSVFRFNSSTEILDNLANDFNVIREQIDDLVQDANYRGINLLNGDDLITYFNEDNTSSLTTRGVVFTAAGLGLTEATFRTAGAIDLGSNQARSALEDVRTFGSTLANSLAVVQVRQNFTQDTINTLKAGRDDLTVADQNEEGANLLALQTRQALGTTALSLAAQSAQSVLRLF